ncbi:MAG: hypothetical protein HY051_01435 [Candidatus Aenigmarchaeota archaeon]|nr:hypothetical protein [Candidatus Aenigmarchaeota archaeon]
MPTDERFGELSRKYFNRDRHALRDVITRTSIAPYVVKDMKRGVIPARGTILKLSTAMSLGPSATNELLTAAGYEEVPDLFQRKMHSLRQKYEGRKNHYKNQLDGLAGFREMPDEWIESAASRYNGLIRAANRSLAMLDNLEALHNSSPADVPTFRQLSDGLQSDPVYMAGDQSARDRMEKRQLSKEDYLDGLLSVLSSKPLVQDELQMLKELFYSPVTGYPSQEGINTMLKFAKPSVRWAIVGQGMEEAEPVIGQSPYEEIGRLLRDGYSYSHIARASGMPVGTVWSITRKQFPDEFGRRQQFSQTAISTGLRVLQETGTMKYHDFKQALVSGYADKNTVAGSFAYWTRWARSHPTYEGMRIIEDGDRRTGFTYRLEPVTNDNAP